MRSLTSARRILSAALCVAAAALGCGAGPSATAPFEKLPPGWKVTSHYVVPRDQAAAIGARLGGAVAELTNTVLDAQGARLQVNVFVCAAAADAEKIHNAVVAAHGGSLDSALRRGNRVVEFVAQDIRLVKRAGYALGLRPMRVTYRITFDAAPLEGADWMAWNRLFNAFLAWRQGPADGPALAEIAALRAKFQFGSRITWRACGQGKQPSIYVMTPKPQSEERAATGDLVACSFGPLPEKAGVPCVSVAATVRSEAFAFVPDARKAGPELLGPTAAWPAADAAIVELAARITAGRKTDVEKVEALLAWMMPGRNLRFESPVTGSRWGVQKVLQQRAGHCWDFADVFVTLCRAAGVPARQVAGWLYGRSGHIWAEVLLEGKGWQQVDPTAGMVCGSDYIPYLTSETGHMPIVYLSMPAIEVLREE